MEIAQWVILAGIVIAAYAIGEVLARVHVPRLPVYLAVGAIAGIVVTSVSETAAVAFPIVNTVALCVIGFVAGSHLVWERIRPRIRPIAYQVIAMTVVVPVLTGLLVYYVLPAELPAPVRLASAVLVGSVMLALSPPEAIAVIAEARAVGPFTRAVLGATVVMDVVVVSTFAAALTISNALVGEGGSVRELIITISAGVGLAVLAGFLVGVTLRYGVERLKSDSRLAVLLFVFAGLAAAATVAAVQIAHVRWSLEVEIEALLVAMIAGLLVANRSSNPERFALVLERVAPWVYVVFFTLTGLGLHVDTLIAAAAPAVLLWGTRIVGLWLASRVAMSLAREPAVVRRVTWRAFVPQAGIALALASTMAAEFPQAGPVLSAVVIGTIVLNEATGPFFLRSALNAVGETVSGQEVLD